MTRSVDTQNAAGAWVTCFDDIRCLEASTTSKAAWLKSLHQGCLNKSVNDKLRAYSHLRSLSSKLTTLHGNEARGRRHTLHLDDSKGEIDDNVREQEEVVQPEQPGQSLAILEDYSRPPLATEEVTPLLFTPTSFFHYLNSDNWGGQVSLRVINGELLSLLLGALCSLEMQFRVNSNIVHANLNNRSTARIEEDTQKEQVIEKATKNELENFPKPYEPRQEFVYEKLNVDIVFYEKSDVSNIPFVIEENGDSGANSPAPMERDVARCAYALQRHVTDYVRLPAFENVDINSTIQTLEAELHLLKEAESPPKDLSALGRLPDKITEKVEWVAEDPYLVPLDLSKATRQPSEASRQPSGNSLLTATTTRPQKRGRITSGTFSRVASEAEVKRLNEKASFVSKQLSAHGLERREDEDAAAEEEEEKEDTGIQSDKSSVGSYLIISTLTEFTSENEQVKTLRKLNLTRNELYASGLYSPRQENACRLEKKLQPAKQIRFTRRKAKETEVYEKLRKSLSFDIADRFQCLAASKINANRKPVSQSSKKEKKLKQPLQASLSLWEAYSQDQEEMEMDSALINEAERGILNRMLTSKVELEPEIKGRAVKNRNKNNPSISGDSLTSPKKEKRIRGNPQVSENVNTSATAKINIKCKSNTKCNLPLIDNKENKKKAMHPTEHNSKDSVSLPPLVQNKVQEKHVKSRKGEQRFIDNTAILDGPLTGGNENQIEGSNVINTKHRNKLSTRYKKICRDTSLGKDIARCANKNRKLESSLQSKRNSNCNRNQNSLSFSGQEYAEEADISALEGKAKAESHESVSTPESSICEAEEEMISVDSYNEKLQQCGCDCDCGECRCLTEALSHENVDALDTYPLLLGQLRRDFKFLSWAKYEPKAMPARADSYFKRPEIGQENVCDNLLKLMDTILVRKETLTSSFGYKYTTLCFSKPGSSNSISPFSKPGSSKQYKPFQ
ncbi:hypothetical protein BsWGS_01885 [Bradybaena similaris]